MAATKKTAPQRGTPAQRKAKLEKRIATLEKRIDRANEQNKGRKSKIALFRARIARLTK